MQAFQKGCVALSFAQQLQYTEESNAMGRSTAHRATSGCYRAPICCESWYQAVGDFSAMAYFVKQTISNSWYLMTTSDYVGDVWASTIMYRLILEDITEIWNFTVATNKTNKVCFDFVNGGKMKVQLFFSLHHEQHKSRHSGCFGNGCLCLRFELLNMNNAKIFFVLRVSIGVRDHS